MATFRDDPADFQRLDFALLQNGPVALYCSAHVLAEDVAWLARDGYAIDVLDASAWRTPADAHDDLARTLAFPGYYGRNLAALNDCLGDLPVPDGSGRAVVARRFDVAVSRLGAFAQEFVDVFATASRRQLLFGRRLVALLQSDDPRLALAPVGACPVAWNPREWLDASRGV